MGLLKPLFFSSIFWLYAVTALHSQSVEQAVAIIPQPVSITRLAQKDQLDLSTINSIYSSRNFKTDPTSDFKNWLTKYYGRTLSNTKVKGKGVININYQDTFSQKDAYVLEILNDRINITYKDEAGAFYAFQSLKQLFPTEKTGMQVDLKGAYVPLVRIYDFPAFAYRGMHMDESRHFFGMDAVKQYIDMLAFQKFNYFHWHLTDDQGWRLEIKQYPKLTEIGSCREETLIGHYSAQPQRFDGKPYCFFYTQEQAKEIVKYAAERFITVVPEIEMPGHAQAILASYPELSCHGKPLKTATLWGIFEDILCPTPETFTFLENVLDEVIEIFPSKYIHIGGDEAPKRQWEESAYCQSLLKTEGLKNMEELQSWFIQRIDGYVSKKGRTIIGWDEILDGGLKGNAVVMSWRGFEGGVTAANQDHYVIMTPSSHCYFDYYQSKNEGEPLSIGGYIPLSKVFDFNPIPHNLPIEKHQFILGGQANLWAEYIATPDHQQYMAYPRSFALSEALWSADPKRDYNKFLIKLKKVLPRLDAWQVNYSKSIYQIYARTEVSAGMHGVKIMTDAPDFKAQYRINSGKQTTTWLDFANNFTLTGEGTLEFRLVDPTSGQVWAQSSKKYAENKVSGATIILEYQPHNKYSTGGIEALVNGFYGTNQSYGGDEWLGFSGKDLIATIDLNKITDFTRLEMRFFHSPGEWIYKPSNVTISISHDGKKWEPVPVTAENVLTWTIDKWFLNFPKQSARYVQVKAARHGIIAEGQQGAGHEAWLFADEILLR